MILQKVSFRENQFYLSKTFKKFFQFLTSRSSFRHSQFSQSFPKWRGRLYILVSLKSEYFFLANSKKISIGLKIYFLCWPNDKKCVFRGKEQMQRNITKSRNDTVKLGRRCTRRLLAKARWLLVARQAISFALVFFFNIIFLRQRERKACGFPGLCIPSLKANLPKFLVRYHVMVIKIGQSD